MCPAGSANPSTDSLNRTTTLSDVISALFTDVNALITAEATSFRTSAVLHAFGNHATWTNGIYYRFFGVFFFFFFFFFFFEVLFLYPTGREREREREREKKREFLRRKKKTKIVSKKFSKKKKKKEKRLVKNFHRSHPPFFLTTAKTKKTKTKKTKRATKGRKEEEEEEEEEERQQQQQQQQHEGESHLSHRGGVHSGDEIGGDKNPPEFRPAVTTDAQSDGV